MNGTKKLWWGLLLLILVSPLGLWLPEIFKSGPAWGEWGLRELEKMLGFVPEGLKKNADLWSAPVPDYNLKGWEGKGLLPSSLGYILSAFLGVGAIALVAFLLGKVLTRKEKAGNRNS
jgi:cobalt/nickel transport protein